MKKCHMTPEGMHRNPAFSQLVTVEGPHRLVVIGGQNAVDGGGSIVGPGDLAAQTEQAMVNLETALAAGGAGLADVVKWTIYLASPGGEPQDAGAAFAAAMKRIGVMKEPPAITLVHVLALANPAFLVEIEALAAVGVE